MHFRGTEAGLLFLTCRGMPLRTNAARTIFRDLSHKAGVDDVHPHRFPHTFATWAIELHAREIDVQYLLGHSTPAMVRRYTTTYNAEKAARAHAMFSRSTAWRRDSRRTATVAVPSLSPSALSE